MINGVDPAEINNTGQGKPKPKYKLKHDFRSGQGK